MFRPLLSKEGLKGGMGLLGFNATSETLLVFNYRQPFQFNNS